MTVANDWLMPVLVTIFCGLFDGRAHFLFQRGGENLLRSGEKWLDGSVFVCILCFFRPFPQDPSRKCIDKMLSIASQAYKLRVFSIPSCGVTRKWNNSF